MLSRATFVSIFLLAICSPAGAFTNTAAELLSICKKGETEKMVCTAFIVGVVHGFVDAKEHIRLTTKLERIPDLFCPIEGWTAGQGLEVFVNWAEKNPDKLEYQPSAVVLSAHREEYPCE